MRFTTEDDYQNLNNFSIMESNATPVKKKPKKPDVPRFRKQTADKDGIISKQYNASNIGSYIKELG